MADEPRIARAPVQPIRERWLCPVEGCAGEMKMSGFSKTIVRRSAHRCDQCGNVAYAKHSYPRIVYE